MSAICNTTVGGPDLSAGIPARSFAHLLVGKQATLPDGRRLEGKDYEKEEWKKQRVDAYTACSALSLAVATTYANDGVEWLKENWEDRYADALLPGDLGRLRGRDDKELLTVSRLIE